MPESKLWAEVWTRPGDANYGRVIDDPQSEEWSFHDGVNQIGDGTLAMPRDFDRFDEIIKVDPDTPADMVSSTVKIFSEEDPDTPIGEWLPNKLIPPEAKDDPDSQVSGLGIKSILAYARTEAWDWDGSDDWTPKFPDWIYGGRNVLSNGSFEDTKSIATIYWLVIDATAGTFTLSDGTDTTSALNYNLGDGQLESEIESDIAAIDDILASPLGDTPIGYQLLITATGGTFVLSSPADSTGNLAAGISAAALETAIEGLSDVTNVSVSAVTVDGDSGFQIDLVSPATIDLDIDTTNLTDGSATLTVSTNGEGFELEGVTPPNGFTLTVNDSGLTGSASLTLVEAGEDLVSSWTKSQQISFGTPREFGVYDAFEQSSAQAHSGTYSLLINPGAINSRIEAFAGAQQTPSVEPGGTYQASVWVYPTAAGQSYRLVVRSIDEDLLTTTGGGNAWKTITPPANTWTQVSIADVVIPDGESRVIFRFANIDLSGNPAPFYIDDAEFNEGLAANTVGKILGDLYNDATSDHSADRIVWEDAANPGSPYLTLDFTDAVDSAGVAWQGDEDIRIPMRMSYSQVMAEFAQRGYEYRVVADDVEAGTYKWQVYNPGGMDAAPDVAIQGGASDVRRRIARFRPKASDFLIEGQARLTSRTRNANLITAIGRIEASRIDREASTLTAAASAAAEDLAKALTGSQNPSYTLVNPQDEPISDFAIGDTVVVEDPPELDTVSLRFVDVNIVSDPSGVEWECQFGSAATVSPDAAVADAVRGLLAKFDYADELGVGGGDPILGGGGAPTVVVAASNASDLAKSKADYVCTGVEDATTIQAAIDRIDAASNGRVLFTEGNFDIGTTQITVPSNVTLFGMGKEATFIFGSVATFMFDVAGSSIVDIAFSNFTNGGGIIDITGGNQARIDSCYLNTADAAAWSIRKSASGALWVNNCYFDGAGDGIIDSGTGGGRYLRITNNIIIGCRKGIHLQATSSWQTQIANNVIRSSSDWGIELSSPAGFAIVGNAIASNGLSSNGGISITNGTGVQVVGNTFDSQRNGPDVYTNGGQTITVAANTSESAEEECIVIEGTAEAVVADNALESSGFHGIQLDGATNCVVEGNVVATAGTATTNTYDGINITGAATRNLIQGNKIIGSAAGSQPRYAVNVGGTGECNMVVGNDLGDCDNYGTDCLVDTALNTQLFYPAHATYGDNFTDCGSGS